MVARQAGVRAGLTEADLFQEGCLGLMIAVDRYDCRRGCRFATYALLWIRAFTGAASARQLGTLNLPTSRASQLRHARGVEAILAQELGRQPTAGEVGEALGRSADWTSRLLTHEHPQGLEEVGDIAADDTELEEVLGRSRRAGGPDLVAGGLRTAGAGAAPRLRRRTQVLRGGVTPAGGDVQPGAPRRAAGAWSGSGPSAPRGAGKVGRLNDQRPQPLKSSPGWTRTNDILINSQALCQLSYRGSRADAATYFSSRISVRRTRAAVPPSPRRRAHGRRAFAR